MTSIVPLTGFVLSPTTASTPFITQRPSLPSLFVENRSHNIERMDHYLYDDDNKNSLKAPPLMEQRRRFYKKGTALWATPPSSDSTTTTTSTSTSEESLSSLNNNNNQGQVSRVEQDENASSTTINVDKDTVSLSLQQQQTNGATTTNDDITSFWKELPSSSIVWLNAVAIIWGTQHPVIKMVVEDSDAAAFSLARFGLGAIIASPYTPGLSTLWKKTDSASDVVVTDAQQEQQDKNVRLAWRWGIEMGLWMFLGYAFQAVGLAFTTAQRSGFLLYLNVKFVPFFARILLGRQISIPTWVSAFAALVGTALLAGGDGSIAPNVGDAWSIGAAAMSAMFILRLESASKEVEDSAQLNAACLWVVTSLAFIWSIVVGGTMTTTTGVAADAAGGIALVSAWEQTISNLVNVCTNHPLELIYLGGVTTALANYMQTRAQRNVTAERASVIYAMDPVYGAFFANLLLGEQLEGWAIVGAAIITVTAATNAFLDLSSSSGSNDDGDSSLPTTTIKKKNLEDML